MSADSVEIASVTSRDLPIPASPRMTTNLGPRAADAAIAVVIAARTPSRATRTGLDTLAGIDVIVREGTTLPGRGDGHTRKRRPCRDGASGCLVEQPPGPAGTLTAGYCAKRVPFEPPLSVRRVGTYGMPVNRVPPPSMTG